MRDLRSSWFHTNTLNETRFSGVVRLTKFDKLIEKAEWEHVQDIVTSKKILPVEQGGVEWGVCSIFMRFLECWISPDEVPERCRSRHSFLSTRFACLNRAVAAFVSIGFVIPWNLHKARLKLADDCDSWQKTKVTLQGGELDTTLLTLMAFDTKKVVQMEVDGKVYAILRMV